MTDQQILSDDQTMSILEVLMLGVTPAISVFGVIGNIFSVIILVKHGLHRCSNILLVSLAVNDISFLVGFNSVPKLLYEIVDRTEGFHFGRGASFVLFAFYQLCMVMDYGCGSVSLTLPVLITAERLIAVFFPLQFNQVVTTRRTWCAVIFISVFWYGFFIHMTFFVVLDFEMDNQLNVTVGLMKRSAYHNQNSVAVAILEEAMSYMTIQIPPLFTLAGCIVIGIKIRIAASQRSKLTSSGQKGELSNRTTKMLMAVCTMYTAACGAMSLSTFIPQYMYYSITSDAPSNLGKVLYQVMNIALCLNSSCNFIIYVAMNKNFRSTYMSLFRPRTSRRIDYKKSELRKYVV
ncbi:neuropeptides capa receptor [Biomphalaria pfeifferi]|uniref:Neuropeptides capa receptor n=1 Tax=Biomphalaria pfeifferi TaxID=112525 RepID=A0AAD8B814_BIOPF|nr:neuropeptides capa receptor [Biomphalaria pfeifferi]